MTVDLSKKTIVTGRELDQAGITQFKTQNGRKATFEYQGRVYTVNRLNGNNEKYGIQSKVPIQARPRD